MRSSSVDAHMGEIYWGEFELRNGIVRAAGPERLGAPTDLAPPVGSAWVAVGGGFAAQREGLAAVLAKAQRALPELEPCGGGPLPGGRRGARSRSRHVAAGCITGLSARAHGLAPRRLKRARTLDEQRGGARLSARLNYFVTMLDCNSSSAWNDSPR